MKKQAVACKKGEWRMQAHQVTETTCTMQLSLEVQICWQQLPANLQLHCAGGLTHLVCLHSPLSFLTLQATSSMTHTTI